MCSSCNYYLKLARSPLDVTIPHLTDYFSRNKELCRNLVAIVLHDIVTDESIPCMACTNA